ncbi:hypothetical protein NDU88_003201 [Pleurodeles waltl]|uniref:Uncharacterized protein n=1 Tax=Pleurodeles waltl TaxID=8319 RepID=A0AAV7LEN1_PLEWA|nr:hypothetical protein NDU88_003201 [Pleurodeles waltl]
MAGGTEREKLGVHLSGAIPNNHVDRRSIPTTSRTSGTSGAAVKVAGAVADFFKKSTCSMVQISGSDVEGVTNEAYLVTRGQPDHIPVCVEATSGSDGDPTSPPFVMLLHLARELGRGARALEERELLTVPMPGCHGDESVLQRQLQEPARGRR